eukprot:PITA_05771
MVNGSPSKTFTPSRGLRQGDLLSPFLFILMMEGLGQSIKHVKEVGSIKGLQLSENGQALTHQQFVDDTMLQGIPTVKEALAYKQILYDFAVATDPKVQWASIWKEKYAITWQDDDHIRMTGIIKCSYIWNKAWENRGLVQKNIFWEIREGDLALFWEDKWQQKPTLLKEEFLDLKKETDTKRLLRVKDFWDQTNSEGKWRTWKNIHYTDDNPLKAKAEAQLIMLGQRKNLVSEGHDQHRWGKNNEGTFNLKQAKHKILELDSNVLDRVWQNLWRHQGWMKIKLFMWLVHHKKILTWEKIRKRGVLGPSRCYLCEAQEEIMERLLNNCIFTSRLWDTFSTIFQQTERDKESIINTLNNWR